MMKRLELRLHLMSSVLASRSLHLFMRHKRASHDFRFWQSQACLPCWSGAGIPLLSLKCLFPFVFTSTNVQMKTHHFKLSPIRLPRTNGRQAEPLHSRMGNGKAFETSRTFIEIESDSDDILMDEEILAALHPPCSDKRGHNIPEVDMRPAKMQRLLK